MTEPRARSRLKRFLDPDPIGPGRLSTSFSQPLGPNFEPRELGGYCLDLRVKAHDPNWPPRLMNAEGVWMWVAAIQWALGCYERYLCGEGERWLKGAIAAAEQLIAAQSDEGPQAGGWVHSEPLPHTYDLQPPWLSSIAQGEGASLLVRLAARTGDERFAAAGRRALEPLHVPVRDGGVRAALGDGFVCEEYPTSPPSLVLNGIMFGLWGCHDVALALDDPVARGLFEEGTETLAANLDRYDTGYWSRYDLYPHRVVNVASPAYHELHIDQLRATARLSGDPAFERRAERWEGYAASRAGAARAFAHKVIFRLAVPRGRLGASRRHAPAPLPSIPR